MQQPRDAEKCKSDAGVGSNNSHTVRWNTSDLKWEPFNNASSGIMDERLRCRGHSAGDIEAEEEDGRSVDGSIEERDDSYSTKLGRWASAYL